MGLDRQFLAVKILGKSQTPFACAFMNANCNFSNADLVLDLVHITIIFVIWV